MKVPNESIKRELKALVWDRVREITTKGGMELYNRLMLDIDRGEIDSEELLNKEIKRK